MDFNPFDGKGNPLAAIGTDAAALALLAMGGWFGKGLHSTGGLIMNQPIKTLATRPISSFRHNFVPYKPKDIGAITKAYTAEEKATLRARPHSDWTQDAEGQPVLIPNSILPDGSPDENWYLHMGLDANGDSIWKTKKASDFAIDNNAAVDAFNLKHGTNRKVGNNEYLPTVWDEQLTPAGTLKPSIVIKDIEKNLNDEAIKAFNKDGTVNRNIKRDYTDEDLRAMADEIALASIHNTTKVPMSELIQERIKAGGWRSMFDKELNAAMDAKIKNNVEARDRITKAIVDGALERKKFKIDDVLKAFSHGAGSTNEEGALNNLADAYQLALDGQILPPKTIGSVAGRNKRPRKGNINKNASANILYGERDIYGSKENNLYNLLRYIATKGKNGFDTSVQDTPDLWKMLGLEGKQDLNLISSIFGSPKFYKRLTDDYNTEVTKKGYINDIMSRYAKTIYGTQSGLRGRGAAG